MTDDLLIFAKVLFVVTKASWSWYTMQVQTIKSPKDNVRELIRICGDDCKSNCGDVGRFSLILPGSHGECPSFLQMLPTVRAAMCNQDASQLCGCCDLRSALLRSGECLQTSNTSPDPNSAESLQLACWGDAPPIPPPPG